jgi:hypothetical protein
MRTSLSSPRTMKLHHDRLELKVMFEEIFCQGSLQYEFILEDAAVNS